MKKTLEELRKDLEKEISSLRKQRKKPDAIEKEILAHLLDLKKQEAITFPELEELFQGVKVTTEKLKQKVAELKSLTE